MRDCVCVCGPVPVLCRWPPSSEWCRDPKVAEGMSIAAQQHIPIPMCRWSNSGIIAAYHSKNLYASLGIGIYHSENLYTSTRIFIPVWGSVYATEQQSTYLQPLLDLSATASSPWQTLQTLHEYGGKRRTLFYIVYFIPHSGLNCLFCSVADCHCCFVLLRFFCVCVWFGCVVSM